MSTVDTTGRLFPKSSTPARVRDNRVDRPQASTQTKTPATSSINILFPACCPVCSSRKIAVYMLDGSWSCWQCGTDSSDTPADRLARPSAAAPPSSGGGSPSTRPAPPSSPGSADVARTRHGAAYA